MLPWWNREQWGGPRYWLAFGLVGCQQPIPGELPAGPGHAVRPKAASAWQPGDDIPGWEGYDYDCPLSTGAGAETVYFPDVWKAMVWFTTPSGDLAVNSSIYVTPTDCTDFECPDSGTGSHSGGFDVYAAAGEWPMGDVFRKTGLYGRDSDRADSYLEGSSVLPLGNFVADGTETRYLGFSLCISRLRPDEIQGVISVIYYDYTLYHAYYSQALVQYPFDNFYEEHAAWDYNYDGFPPDDDAFRHAIYYDGNISYDTVWDWGAITDPAIRDLVYDAYTPSNVP